MSFGIVKDKEYTHSDLVGLKVKGFKFDGFPAFIESNMTQYIDVIGTITSCQERACSITFYNPDKFHSTDTWQYPYPEILDYLILEETFEEEKHKLTEIENLKNLKNYESRTTTATSKVSSF